MDKAAGIYTRVDRHTKQKFTHLCKQIGLSQSAVLSALVQHAIDHQVKAPLGRFPNDQLKQTIARARSGQGVRAFQGIDQLLADLYQP